MTAAHVTEATELERVEAWRLQELQRAGYPPDAAAAIAARHDVDLHHAVSLVERGCPPEIAVRILL